MVYIGKDGQVLQNRPWNLARIISILAGLWFFIVNFIQTLFAPFKPDVSSSSSSKGSWSTGWGGGGGGSGGGGGGGSGGGGGRGPGPNRRIGRISHTSSINAGGCSGGSCGM